MKIYVMGFEERAIRVIKQNRSLKNSVGSKFRNRIGTRGSSIDYSKAEKEQKFYPKADKTRAKSIITSLIYFVIIIGIVIFLGALLL